jgi:hypothetical protein
MFTTPAVTIGAGTPVLIWVDACVVVTDAIAAPDGSHPDKEDRARTPKLAHIHRRLWKRSRRGPSLGHKSEVRLIEGCNIGAACISGKNAY